MRLSTLRIPIQQHLRQILQRRFPFRKGNLPDAIEDFAVPLGWLQNSQSFGDGGNVSMMPADQNYLAGVIVENCIDHLPNGGGVFFPIHHFKGYLKKWPREGRSRRGGCGFFIVSWRKNGFEGGNTAPCL